MTAWKGSFTTPGGIVKKWDGIPDFFKKIFVSYIDENHTTSYDDFINGFMDGNCPIQSMNLVPDIDEIYSAQSRGYSTWLIVNMDNMNLVTPAEQQNFSSSRLDFGIGGTTYRINRNLGEPALLDLENLAKSKGYELERYYRDDPNNCAGQLTNRGKDDDEDENVAEQDGENNADLNNEDNDVKYDKNIILYGPPGTGKTYSTAIYAVAICDNREINDVKNEDYSDVLERYNELKNDEHRIAFTTFHQSYGYEEFIEGIKPELDGGETGTIGYSIVPGVFKSFCTEGIVENDSFEEKWNSFVDYVLNNGGKTKIDLKTKKREIEWKSQMNRFYVSDHKSHNQFVDYDTVFKVYSGLIKEDWASSGTRTVKYTTSLGIIKKLKSDYELAEHTNGEQPNEQNKVFIIDEINRGNISKIFGELITLIEDNKRKGMPEAADAILPYSGELFSVPSNVYILGTMNTADRSIALMDTALRRRFSFVEMMPKYDKLKEIEVNGANIDIARMLSKINERIEYLYDREHMIGHAFFKNLNANSNIDELASIFKNSVIPLLQEYFYEDYKKIQLILGDNAKVDNLKFIKDSIVNPRNAFKGNVGDIDLPEKKYEINEEALKNPDSYRQIYE